MGDVPAKVGAHVEWVKPYGLVLVSYRRLVVSDPGVGQATPSVCSGVSGVDADGRAEVFDRNEKISPACVCQRSPTWYSALPKSSLIAAVKHLIDSSYRLAARCVKRLPFAGGGSSTRCHSSSCRFRASFTIQKYLPTGHRLKASRPPVASRHPNGHTCHECTLS